MDRQHDLSQPPIAKIREHAGGDQPAHSVRFGWLTQRFIGKDSLSLHRCVCNLSTLMQRSEVMQATWNGAVVAASNDTVVVEGNHYFPPESLNHACLRPSTRTSVCAWKGTANYYHVVVDGQENPDAAWYYPDPKSAADNIRGRVAFWRGVKVVG